MECHGMEDQHSCGHLPPTLTTQLQLADEHELGRATLRPVSLARARVRR